MNQTTTNKQEYPLIVLTLTDEEDAIVREYMDVVPSAHITKAQAVKALFQMGCEEWTRVGNDRVGPA